MESSGSVVPLFIEQILSKQKISITDPNMTRVSTTMDEALDFIFSIKESKGSDTFVPKLKAYNIMDLKDVLFEMLGKTQCAITKIRQGEKLAELLINSYFATHGTKTLIIRCTNNYGPRQFPEKLIPKVITRASQNKNILVYGSGKNIRDWIFVDDHCEGILKILVDGKDESLTTFLPTTK